MGLDQGLLTMFSLSWEEQGLVSQGGLKGRHVMRDLRTYFIQVRCVFQVEGLLAETQHRVVSKTSVDLSNWPLVQGLENQGKAVRYH